MLISFIILVIEIFVVGFTIGYYLGYMKDREI